MENGCMWRLSCIISPGTSFKGGLFLGDFFGAQDTDQLSNNKITAVLSVIDGSNPKEFYDKLGIFHMFIEAKDVGDQDLSGHFQESHDFILEHMSKGNVLVHCLTGVSRSTTIAAAFFMRTQKIGWKAAIEKIRKGRPVANPNEGFLRQLEEFEKEVLKP